MVNQQDRSEKIFPVGRKFLLIKKAQTDRVKGESLGRNKDGSGGWIRTTILGAKVPCPAVRRPRIRVQYKIPDNQTLEKPY